jgi:hypothetical protein
MLYTIVLDVVSQNSWPPPIERHAGEDKVTSRTKSWHRQIFSDLKISFLAENEFYSALLK